MSNKLETSKLKKFAQFARRSLIEQVTAKLKLVLAPESAARREHPSAVQKLEEAIKDSDQGQVIERVAYTWFNRFCALRFMDVNRYNPVGVVSPTEGQFQPEVLAEAKMGHIDEDRVSDRVRYKVFALLEGRTPSADPQGEAYRLLVVAACNHWHKAMPFLFERIEDYTELLMPDDLLSGNSILAYTREAMTPEACEDVEVIGWLYQFYISEKKDQVFADLKKNKKITPDNIPAATQLFTPHWIVRYLVENSLGRLWLLNRPNSALAQQMEYYIRPEEPESDFLRVSSPEEIKICDPACGSGHMLTYAFDLLYAIYEEEGYEPSEIPEKILTHNLFGIEIDERAGELAAFALIMKARARQRRFFNKGIKPNICVLENIHFDADELSEYMDFIGRDLFTTPLQTTLRQFEEADNFGSLIRPELTDVEGVLSMLEAKDVSGQLFLNQTHQKVLKALRQADYLSPHYHLVVANPPYMGAKGMNSDLSSFANDSYPTAKFDLYAMFIERNLEFAKKNGMVAMITMQGWMFLSFFAKFRDKLLSESVIENMAHLGPRAFDSIGGEVVSTTTFVIERKKTKGEVGVYLRLVNGDSEPKKNQLLLQAVKRPDCEWRYQGSANDFEKLPGSPIAYWVDRISLRAFSSLSPLRSSYEARVGLQSNDNNRFLRFWFEVPLAKIGFKCTDNEDARNSAKKWFPYQKGGSFRRWYGNHEYVINWENGGSEIIELASSIYGSPSRTVRSKEFYFRPALTWSTLSTGDFAVRWSPGGFMFDIKGSCLFPLDNEENDLSILGLLNSRAVNRLLEFTSPTLDYSTGAIESIPIPEFSNCQKEELRLLTIKAIDLSMHEWDRDELSWGFEAPPTVKYGMHGSLDDVFSYSYAEFLKNSNDLSETEERINALSDDAYGYSGAEQEPGSVQPIDFTTWLSVELKKLISYAVGCMFGRYALEKEGLVLANQGETIEDYLKQIPQPSFPADDDNVIPMLDGDWFTDDITERFRQFLKLTFGEEHYEDNLRYVEQGLNIKGKRNYSIRDYFLKEFYDDHVRRYKKRPIYWLFSSPKGSFNALIYMHRYQPHTVGTVLEYLRDFQDKLKSSKDRLESLSIKADISSGEKTKALKEIEKINKMLIELEEYERDVLYPLATEQITIDLDDGVKANYPQFGNALKKITGLS